MNIHAIIDTSLYLNTRCATYYKLPAYCKMGENLNQILQFQNPIIKQPQSFKYFCENAHIQLYEQFHGLYKSHVTEHTQ